MADTNMEIDLTSSDTHPIRITSGGKLKNWVSFALDHFEKLESKPISFHTLSPELPGVETTDATAASTSTSAKPKPKSKSFQGASLAPRLISVVEIIKRQYVKRLEETHSTRLLGLYQYNEIGTLDSLAADEETEEDRAAALAMALDGKHVQQKQTPFMRITLSTHALEGLVEKGATYQEPSIRKLTKSAKARAKKREKKAAQAGGAAAAEPEAAPPDAVAAEEEAAPAPVS